MWFVNILGLVLSFKSLTTNAIITRFIGPRVPVKVCCLTGSLVLVPGVTACCCRRAVPADTDRRGRTLAWARAPRRRHPPAAAALGSGTRGKETPGDSRAAAAAYKSVLSHALAETTAQSWLLISLSKSQQLAVDIVCFSSLFCLCQWRQQ